MKFKLLPLEVKVCARKFNNNTGLQTLSPGIPPYVAGVDPRRDGTGLRVHFSVRGTYNG